MRRILLLAVPLTLLVTPLAAQTTGQGGTGSLLNPLGQGSAYPQGTVNPNLMPRPGANSAAGGTSGSQAVPNPNGGLPSGAAAADGQQPGASRGGGRGGGGGGGGGLAPGVTPVPSAGGRSGGGGGGGSAGGAFTASGGGRSGGGARGNTGTGNTASVPVGRAAQWVLCPDDDSEIAAELGGGMSCAP